MNIPGGDDLIERGTAIIFEYWENDHARCTPGYKPMRWRDLADVHKRQLMGPQRAFAELIVVATIAHQTATVKGYDRLLGPTFEAVITQYSTEELDHHPATHGS